MSPLLEQKYRYTVFEPVDSVRSQLKSILNTPWYDIAVNLSGSLSDDNTFILYPKLIIGVEIFGVVQSPALLSGRIEPAGEQTNIIVTVRPNHAVLLAFYLTVIIFLFKLVGLFTSGTETNRILVVALLIMLILILSMIHFSAGRLKNRFERILSVHPED